MGEPGWWPAGLGFKNPNYIKKGDLIKILRSYNDGE